MLSDDFDDFIDRIKKYFKLDSDIFEIDFLFLPESEIKKGRIHDNKKVKGFKISYHYENGMDKPEIKIEGDIENNKVWDYLKEADLSNLPNIREFYDRPSIKELDVDTLSLESYEDMYDGQNELTFLEPYTEICNNEGYTEILVEIPRIKKEDIKINFRDEGKKLVITACNEERKYMTTVDLPFGSSKQNCELEVNNGLAIIKLSKYI